MMPAIEDLARFGEAMMARQQRPHQARP